MWNAVKVARPKWMQIILNSRMFSNTTGLPIVTVFTKDDCELCDVAMEELCKFQSETNQSGQRFSIESKDITDQDNKDWLEKYQHDIPVIHLNGQEIMRHRVFPNVIRDALANLPVKKFAQFGLHTKSDKPITTKTDELVLSKHPQELKSIKNLQETWKNAYLQSCINYFSYNSLYPHDHLRKDETWLQQARQSDTTQFAIFQNLNPCLTMSDGRTLKFAKANVTALNKFMEHSSCRTNVVFLGHEESEIPKLTSNKSAWFAVSISPDTDASEFLVDPETAKFHDAFPAMMRLSHNDAAIAAQSRSLLAWNEYHCFCSCCGTSTRSAEGGHKRLCENNDCITNQGIHQASYPRLDPVVKALVVSPDGKSILLGRQVRFPTNLYTCLSGFVEAGESLEDAARREVWEEAGVRITDIRYHSSQPWPFPSTILMGYTAKSLDIEVNFDTEELADARWFNRKEVTRALANDKFSPESVFVPGRFSLAYHLIKKWLEE